MAKAKAADETAAGTARTARKSAGGGGSAAAKPQTNGGGPAAETTSANGGAAAAAGVKGRNAAVSKRASAKPAVGGAAGAEKGTAAGASPAAERTTAGPRKGTPLDSIPTPRKAPSRAKKPDLKADLRDFASARPSGWNHDDWLTFLGHLSSRGHDTSDHENVGRQLESERLALVLERVDGLKPKQVQALVGHFGTLWSLRNAGVDQLADAAGIPIEQAERVAQSVREG
jgi:hypothetical protein